LSTNDGGQKDFALFKSEANTKTCKQRQQQQKKKEKIKPISTPNKAKIGVCMCSDCTFSFTSRAKDGVRLVKC
jgi:hypothetical protein